MKKYLLAASFLITLTPLMASASLSSEAAESAAGRAAAVRAVEPTLNVQSVFKSFSEDPSNYEVRGSTFGFGGTNALKQNAVDGVLLPAVTHAQQTYTAQLRQFFATQMDALQRAHAEALEGLSRKNSEAIKEQQRAHAAELDSLSRKNAEALNAQSALNTATLASIGGVSKALGEAQEQRDVLRAQVQALTEDLQAANGRALVLKTAEEALLLEAGKKDAAAILEQARKRLLEEENGKLRTIVAELAAKEVAIARLLRENDDNSQVLSIQVGNADEIAAAQRQITAVIERNTAEIQALKQAKVALELSKRETEEKTRKLEQAIEVNDFYTQILRMIKNRKVSDDDLALYIWSITTVLDADLDKLSAGRKKRLVVALINVSQPYGDRPAQVSPAYKDSFRTLGNLFTPHGLAWTGADLDYNTCHHAGSKFEQSSYALARDAKARLVQSAK